MSKGIFTHPFMILILLLIIDWYSSGVYYFIEGITDFIGTTISATLLAVIIFFSSNQLNEAKRFWAFFYAFQLLFHTIIELANFMTIILSGNELICLLLPLLVAMSNGLLSNMYVPASFLPKILEIISHTSIYKFAHNMIVISIFGFNRCPQNQTSMYLFLTDMTDENEFWVQSTYIWLQFIILKILSLMAIIIKNNPAIYSWLYNYCNMKTKKYTNNEIELQTIINSLRNSVDNSVNEQRIEASSQLNNQDQIQITQCDDNEDKRCLSIAWIDLTLKVHKTFYSKEKLILRGIKGFVEFGTLTALMGPSGAGKTSLLKSLNGMHRNLFTNDSKIYLSNSKKIRTSFIAQDQREHIINGLTVNQALTYASKLKNTGKSMDHDMNVNELLTELAINDIKDKNIEKCSSGQQKRVVMAMELTSKVKPNLICVDEPTSGVDSYSALLVSNSILD